jgi:UDP-N-acetylmuramate--alanine ligase
MSGIARMLLQLGVPVSGSDVRESSIIRELRQRGADIRIGHTEANVHGAGQVVVSSAIKPDNPELIEANRLGIPVIHRAKKLAELVNSHRGIAVAGTHGKTTTSSLVASVLSSAGVVPSYVVGGIINTMADNARAGQSDWFVIEADESDGSLVEYRAEIGILTNIELDHTDYYRDLSHVKEVFARYVSNIRDGGLCAYCADDPATASLVESLAPPYVERISYGLKPGARLTARDIEFEGLGSTSEYCLDGRPLGRRVHLAIPGVHNVQNSLAVVAAALRVGLPFEQIAEGLELFRGVQRRFQIIGRNDSFTVVDDYAHHPSEIRATLSAARAVHPNDRIIGIFQPHRYSRTKSLAQEFGTAFSNADEVVITGIYGAGEDPLPDVSSELIVDSLRANSHPSVQYIDTLDGVTDYVAQRVRPRDLVITLGAGDVWKVAQSLAQRLIPRPQTAQAS